MEEPLDAIVLQEPQADSPAPQASQTCAACGAPLDGLDKFCPACGAPHRTAVMAEAVEADTAEPIQKFFRCETCGAEVATDPDVRSYVCPFCDSTYVVEYSPEVTGRQPPEFVIGFAVTLDKAQEQFREWISTNTWYRPGDLEQAKVVERLKGVYIPFWSFSMLAQSGWNASIGEYWYRTETYTTVENGKTVTKTRTVRETEWWDLSGRHHRYYSGYLVSGSRGLPQGLADRVKPFHLAGLKRYAPSYLAGWLSEEYSIARDDALHLSKQVFHQQEQSNIAAFLPGDTHRGLRVSTTFSDVNSDLILLPVYILSYRHGEKVYRFLLNGQTGKCDGDKPISWKRISIAIVVGLLLVGGLIATIALLSQY